MNNGVDLKNAQFTVTAGADGSLSIVGFYNTYPIVGTFDGTTGVIKFAPNQFVLHNTYYDLDVYYNGYAWNDAGNDINPLADGFTATFDGKEIIFDQDDLVAVEIPGKGFFALYGDIEMTSEAVEEDFSDKDADIAWEDAGTASFTNGWIVGYLSNYTAADNAYDVQVQKHPDLEGVYRLVEPFKGASFTSILEGAGYTYKPGYIKFNIANENAPYVYSEVFSGLITDSGDGFYCYDILGYYGMSMLAAIQQQMPQYLSTYSDKKLTIKLPLFGEGATGMNDAYNWNNVQDAVIDLSKLSGISDIEIAAPEAKAEYYNLQGVRIAEAANGIFIKVQGGKAVKVAK